MRTNAIKPRWSIHPYGPPQISLRHRIRCGSRQNATAAAVECRPHSSSPTIFHPHSLLHPLLSLSLPPLYTFIPPFTIFSGARCPLLPSFPVIFFIHLFHACSSETYPTTPSVILAPRACDAWKHKLATSIVFLSSVKHICP